jgi:hypothetical protein
MEAKKVNDSTSAFAELEPTLAALVNRILADVHL